MATNKQSLGRVSMDTANRPAQRFPLSADVYTSCGFGEVQPVLFQPCQPNSTSKVSHDVLVRLAPLLSPTRSRMGVRLTTKFVGMSELTENFPFFLANRAVARAEKTFIPTKMPHMSLQKLSMMCLIGAKITFFAMQGAENDVSDYCAFRRYRCNEDYSNLSSGFVSLSKVLANTDTINATTLDDNDLFTTSPTEAAFAPFGTANNRGYLNVYRLFGLSAVNNGGLWLPVLAPHWWDFFEHVSTDGEETVMSYEVDPRGADFVIPVHLTHGDSDRMVAVCVKLSAFGERLRKAMLGVGYELDFYSTEPKSLMPLFALYKAWFDSYAPQLYENWTLSAVYRLLFEFEKNNVADFGAQLRTLPVSVYENLIHFFVDLGNLWYTEEQDVVTAHIRSIAVAQGGEVSSALGDLMHSINSPDGTIHVGDNVSTLAEPNTPDTQNGHSYINGAMQFSQLDLEILRKAYQVVNRETIAGQRIAKILRANGLGSYVDECKSHFVGETWVNVDVNDVNATADSFNSATRQGSTLGSYVGKGVGYESGKTFEYRAQEYGYLITLACVVPDSGYCQQEAPWVNSVERDDFYLPDWDGKGMEANDKKILCGQIDFYDFSEPHELEKTFGYAPRMTRHKMSIGRFNGNFSLRSNRDLPLTYSTAKFIAVGERDVSFNSGTDDPSRDYASYSVNKGFKPSQMPCATPNLRYVGRMKWLSNFDRIFNLEGRPSPLVYNPLNLAEGSYDGTFVWYELTHQTYDNFLLFVNNNLTQWFGALAIEDSFETRENGNVGKSDISIGKA